MAFFKRKRPTAAGRRTTAIPDGLWVKCPSCEQLDYKAELEANQRVCTHCNHHYRLDARTRVAWIVDPGTFHETHAGLLSADPLHFEVGEDRYADRLEKARRTSGQEEAMITGHGMIEHQHCVLAAMDTAFMMASMGSVVGEKFCRMTDDAIAESLPVVVFAASGGARMQEGILALMQMAKTADAVRRLNEARLPYIVVLTDPTSGGVFASFAGLGDITLAEPNAYIGFTGARLIEGALKVKLPPGFQRTEYQYENGFIDRIVKRSDLRFELGRLLRYLAPAAAPQAAQSA